MTMPPFVAVGVGYQTSSTIAKIQSQTTMVATNGQI
jgi:hypothetical protein